jgi:hypothetical protein
MHVHSHACACTRISPAHTQSVERQALLLARMHALVRLFRECAPDIRRLCTVPATGATGGGGAPPSSPASSVGAARNVALHSPSMHMHAQTDTANGRARRTAGADVSVTRAQQLTAGRRGSVHEIADKSAGNDGTGSSHQSAAAGAGAAAVASSSGRGGGDDEEMRATLRPPQADAAVISVGGGGGGDKGGEKKE